MLLSPTEEMVEAWLQQLDKVSEKGEPTWSILVAALKRIGHNGIAIKIVKERGSGGIYPQLYNILTSNIKGSDAIYL